MPHNHFQSMFYEKNSLHTRITRSTVNYESNRFEYDDNQLWNVEASTKLRMLVQVETA